MDMNSLFVEKVKKFIDDNRMLNKGDRVVVGVSSGPDSVALLVVLNEIKNEYELDLKVVHVHHGLRAQADEEAQYVESLCKDLGVECIVKRFDVNKESKALKMGTEEAGRYLRYKAFEEAAGEKGKIAIAHNLNDRAETMLFFLCRGTGPRGMASIKAVSGNRIRPLLNTERKEIEEFLQERNIRYYIDASNLENDYTRNRIRNKIMPLLMSDVNDNAISHIATASRMLEGQNDFVNECARKAYSDILIEKSASFVSIKRSDFNELHDCLKLEIIKLMIDDLVVNNKDITLAHIEAIKLISERSSNASVDIPYSLKGTAEYDVLRLSVTKEEKPESFSTFIDGSCELQVKGLGTLKVKIEPRPKDFTVFEKQYTKCFDYDRISTRLELRKRLSKDYLTINKDLGVKKLKDYFMDIKMPKAQRDETFLLSDDSHVLWVIGYRISEYYKVTEKTKTIMTVEVVKEEK